MMDAPEVVNTPRMQLALDIADAVLALVNSKPQTPTRTEIYETALHLIAERVRSLHVLPYVPLEGSKDQGYPAPEA